MCIHSTLDHWFLPKHLQLGLVSHSFKMTPLLVLLQPLQQPIRNTLVYTTWPATHSNHFCVWPELEKKHTRRTPPSPNCPIANMQLFLLAAARLGQSWANKASKTSYHLLDAILQTFHRLGNFPQRLPSASLEVIQTLCESEAFGFLPEISLASIQCQYII